MPFMRRMAILRPSGLAIFCLFPVRLAVAKILEAAGCSFDDIIDVTSFHTDPENQFGDIMAVKGVVFDRAPYPNWTAVGVTWLSGFDFEIKVVARIPDAQV